MRKNMILCCLLLLASVPAFGAGAGDAAAPAVDHAGQLADLRKAAERGDALAQWRLGVAFDTGDGVKADPAEAVKWFQRAVASGSAQAHASMALMFATGRGVPVDFQAARDLYRKAAAMGETHGFYGVAVLYARGEGVPQDMTEAMAWMLVAGSQGDEQATKLINSGAFDSVDAQKAIPRAEAILKEFGLPAVEFRYQDVR
ncbi:sel1 repeat family protein [Sandaracinobacter neustonicus]|uniref:Sel1 repeat family protein n=1 Tax=Sandaracinobacter neustonicus TaxID=1715348 RepID=A0A501XI17_9SPHN|nr:tetratricopeptide repeat protein [Sandaracinobacter neustonicus]TPE60059.1 sel1 repeat family protein [Sandaracinobacter neustonicus]